MNGTIEIFDRQAVRRHRDRAGPLLGRVRPVLSEAAERLLDRLHDTTQRFDRALEIGGRGVVAPLLKRLGVRRVFSSDLSPRLARRAGAPAVAADEEWLPFAPASFDLIVSNLGLHWVNDLPGALIQLRRALRPGGLFLASLPALGTLDELRAALTATEAALAGGASPRVSPFPDAGDCAGLLLRAGFVAPVVDVDAIRLLYANPLDLLHELRAAGETNAVLQRDRRTPSPTLFPAALARLPQRDGRVEVTLRLAMLTAWAPGTAASAPPAAGAPLPQAEPD